MGSENVYKRQELKGFAKNPPRQVLAMLMRPNKVETAVHGLPDICLGDLILRMRTVKDTPGDDVSVCLPCSPLLS